MYRSNFFQFRFSRKTAGKSRRARRPVLRTVSDATRATEDVKPSSRPCAVTKHRRIHTASVAADTHRAASNPDDGCCRVSPGNIFQRATSQPPGRRHGTDHHASVGEVQVRRERRVTRAQANARCPAQGRASARSSPRRLKGLHRQTALARDGQGRHDRGRPRAQGDAPGGDAGRHRRAGRG